MMFSDEEIKEIPETGFTRPGDEIISIWGVCFSDKLDGFNGESFLPNSSRSDLEASRSLFRDGFFPEGLEQARFAWTEEDGNIASLVSEPGFGTTGQATFGKELDVALKSEMSEADTSSSVLQTTYRNGLTFITKVYGEQQVVSSTSSPFSFGSGAGERSKVTGACKVDKTDPRSRYHYVKYVKRHGRTVKLWECGICSREFQHQYTLLRHLPTHTDERNFHCAACGKSFRQLSTLSQHRAIHSAARPYACELCNKTFNRVSTLISHRKTHNFEKPYKCYICFKGFHQKGNLRNHVFTHTNERPYRCNICFKGFNQQSNLVCHKNKAHPDEACNSSPPRDKKTPVTRPATETQPDSSKAQPEHCEVTSSVGPFLPSVEGPSTSTWPVKAEPWEMPKRYESGDFWNDSPWSIGNGVIVDPIKTYHMDVALATKQTPFALLKPDNDTPVLVKVVDTRLPGGKQMLVPATAEDIRIGGKIVMNSESGDANSQSGDNQPTMESNAAVQIRVPVVATVVPWIKPGGRLQLTVEEPHHAYQTTLSSDGAVNSKPCTARSDPQPGPSRVMPRPEMQRHDSCSSLEEGLRTGVEEQGVMFLHHKGRILRPGSVVLPGGQLSNGARISSACALPPPAPSPPLDLISMDLFEPMECILPLGPQITAVENIDQPPSDDSDIFIGNFEESIQLSDSD